MTALERLEDKSAENQRVKQPVTTHKGIHAGGQGGEAAPPRISVAVYLCVVLFVLFFSCYFGHFPELACTLILAVRGRLEKSDYLFGGSQLCDTSDTSAV